MLLALVLAAAPVVDASVYPLTAQVNDRGVRQFAHVGTVGWHLRQGFALVATGYFANPVLSRASPLRTELLDKTRLEPASPAMFMDVFAGLGTELSHLAFELAGIPVELVVSGGLGAASTRIELKPQNSGGPSTYGDTGWRLGFMMGVGARAQLSRRVSVNLELRDFASSNGVSNVNGCSRMDMQALDRSIRADLPSGPLVVSDACQLDRFTGTEDSGDTDPSNDRKRADDIPLAYQRLRAPRAELLHNLQLMLGVSVRW